MSEYIIGNNVNIAVLATSYCQDNVMFKHENLVIINNVQVKEEKEGIFTTEEMFIDFVDIYNPQLTNFVKASNLKYKFNFKKDSLNIVLMHDSLIYYMISQNLKNTELRKFFVSELINAQTNRIQELHDDLEIEKQLKKDLQQFAQDLMIGK